MCSVLATNNVFQSLLDTSYGIRSLQEGLQCIVLSPHGLSGGVSWRQTSGLAGSSCSGLRRTLDFVADHVCLDIHPDLVDPIFGTQLDPQGTTAFHVTLSHPLADGS